MVDRVLQNKWLVWGSQVTFLIGAAKLVLGWVTEWDAFTVIGFVLVVAGLAGMVVPAVRYRMPYYLFGLRLRSPLKVSDGLIRDGQAIRTAAQKGYYETPAHAAGALIRWRNRADFFFTREAPIYNDAMTKAFPHAQVVTNQSVASWAQSLIDVVVRAQKERGWR